MPSPVVSRVLGWMLAAAWLAGSPALATPPADFGHEAVSAQARQVADWVLESRDHAGRPFIIVDKLQSHVFVFDGEGRLTGAAPALLGLALGDESVPGIGARTISAIRPDERTTPAGRFVGSLERNLHGGEILWVDYDAGVALHPVVTNVPKERRLQRLDSVSVSDNRITYGCINVPAAFFERVVAPLFRPASGVVYVLPEMRPAGEAFRPAVIAPDLPAAASQPGR